MFTAVIMYT